MHPIEQFSRLELDAETSVLFGLVVTAIIAIASMIAVFWTAHAAARASAVNQTAVFRQAWINELREALSHFHSLGVTPGQNPGLREDFYRWGTKIELMMNPGDPDYEELQGLLYEYLSASNADTIEKFSINSRFVHVSQRILKREWERLKNDLRRRRI